MLVTTTDYAAILYGCVNVFELLFTGYFEFVGDRLKAGRWVVGSWEVTNVSGALIKHTVSDS